MFKRNLIAVSLAFAALASAQVSAEVVGGGATLPEKLYGTTVGTGILAKTPLPGFNAYIGVGSGGGKRAFFNNDATEFGLASGITVDYAGSDSVVVLGDMTNYRADLYGPVVQLPSAATSVTVPFNVPGLPSLSLTSEALAEVFAGVYEFWFEVPGVDQALLDDPNEKITVVYRADGSGTTEIFLRHLNAVDGGSVPSVSNSFASAVSLDTNIHVGASGSAALVAAVNSTPGAIGYVSPDYADFDNAAEVVGIKRGNETFLPDEVSVTAALESISLPTDEAEVKEPLNWGLTAANPGAGYPIVGVTNLIFSQCYKDVGDNARIQNFLGTHYTGGNNATISSHSLIPLPAAWQEAVYNNFVTDASGLKLNIGNTSICNGIGRPL